LGKSKNKPRFAGGPLYRKVRLEPGEIVIKEAGSYLLTFWGWTHGNVSLTNRRIIWSPFFAFLAGAKAIRLSEITEVGVHRNSGLFVPGAWYVRTGNRIHRFESLHDFWGGAKPEEWVSVVRSALKTSSA
jgi:hypothetical protein